MRLSAGCALDFERVEEVLLLVVSRPQVGHSAALESTLPSQRAQLMERPTHPSNSAFTVSANIVKDIWRFILVTGRQCCIRERYSKRVV